MIYYAAVPLTVLVALLQVAAASAFTVAGVHPDLPVAWLACWAVIRGRAEAMPLILVAGVALGLLAPEPLGASLLALLPIAALAVPEDQRFLRNRFSLAVAVALAAGVAYIVVQALAAYVGGDTLGGLFNVLRVAPRGGVVDAALAALLYWPLRLLLPRRERRGSFRRI